MTTRRCANWLQTYREYILPRTDAPESYVQWSGLFALAAALRRKVWLPKSDLGLWECYPYVYIMFVGPPGFRKTTTIEKGAQVLLEQIPELEPFRSPDLFTKESILERMSMSSEASMHLVVGEFSDVFQIAGRDRAGIYEFLTSMYDGKTKLDRTTKTSGSLYLEKPCLNFFTATTPGWIRENMPDGMISGGFASRMLIVNEDQPRIRQTFFRGVEPNKSSGYSDFLTMEKDLLLDLMHISTQLAGPFNLPNDSYDFIDNWTKDEQNYKFKNEKMAGYMQRKFTQIAKIAMLHSVAMSDAMTLTEVDWRYAINMVESTEAGMEKLFGGMGKNKYAVDVQNIISYVKGITTYMHKPVTYAELLTNFHAAAEPRILDDLIELAVNMRAIKSENTYIDGVPHTIFTPMV